MVTTVKLLVPKRLLASPADFDNIVFILRCRLALVHNNEILLGNF